jgi:hypothetical protein
MALKGARGEAEPENPEATVTFATWEYAGSGYLTAGDLWLVENKAESHREELVCAREDKWSAA